MAKKKVTKKKTRAGAGRKVAKTTKKKKKTAKKTTRRVTASASKRSAAKKKTAKKTTRKTTKKTTKKVAKKPATKKKPAAVKKKTPAAKGKKTTAAGKKVSKKIGRGKGARAVATPAPDANGYVIINGRRVRIMSAAAAEAAAARPAVTKRTRVRRKAAEEASPAAAADKPIKTKLNKKELDHYRNLLLIQRAELVGDLSAMEAQALQAGGGNLSHMPIHMADIGTDTFDQDFMLGLAETERRRLREIDDALKRIEDKTYGVCQMTGKPIPKARMNAKPWARYTIEAAREIERGLTE